MKYESGTGDELRALGGTFVRELARAAHGATLVTLSGELGAGKTTFVQGVAHALGVKEVVASPTFVIEKIYPLVGQRWQRLVHIDAYRLNPPPGGAQELAVIGWDALLADSGNLIMLEWPERIPDAIPVSTTSLRFEIAGDGRIITSNDGEKESAEN